jgi:membrane associated rhomboid family serine protease
VRTVAYMVAPLSDRSVARVIPPRPFAAAATMLLFAAVLYLVEAVDQFTPLVLDDDGIRPWSLDGVDGILWSPLLHSGWGHLVSNTLPFLLFGFLAMAGGIRQWLVVTAVIWVVGGVGVWLTGGTAINSHIGASGVIFGWLTFLLARGVFARSGRQIALAAVLLFFWGGLLWGVLPGAPDVSWQAHLFGALAGILAARVVTRRASRRPLPQAPGAF